MIPLLATLVSPEWSLVGVVALIAIFCAVIAVLRGAVRLTWWSLRLAMAVVVGYWIWWYSVDWLLLMWKNAPIWGQVLVPLAAVVLIDTLLLRLKSIVLQPFRRQIESSDGTPRSGFSRLLSLVGSLVASAILGCLVLLCLRHLGNLEELKGQRAQSFFLPFKHAIDRYIPPAWTQRFDPLAAPERLTVARLLMIARGDTVPRAVPVPLQSAEDQPPPRHGVEAWLDQIIRQLRQQEPSREQPLNPSWQFPAWSDLLKKWGFQR